MCVCAWKYDHDYDSTLTTTMHDSTMTTTVLTQSPITWVAHTFMQFAEFFAKCVLNHVECTCFYGFLRCHNRVCLAVGFKIQGMGSSPAIFAAD